MPHTVFTFKSWSFNQSAMNSLVIELLVSVLLFTCGNSQRMHRKILTLDSTPIACSPNMACRLAVCLWAPIPTISEERCTIFDNTCTCPEGQICSISDHFTPRNKFVTFEYRCRTPADILQGVHS